MTKRFESIMSGVCMFSPCSLGVLVSSLDKEKGSRSTRDTKFSQGVIGFGTVYKNINIKYKL